MNGIGGAVHCTKRVFVGGQEDELAFANFAHLYACGHEHRERTQCGFCGVATACPSTSLCSRHVRQARPARELGRVLLWERAVKARHLQKLGASERGVAARRTEDRSEGVHQYAEHRTARSNDADAPRSFAPMELKLASGTRGR